MSELWKWWLFIGVILGWIHAMTCENFSRGIAVALFWPVFIGKMGWSGAKAVWEDL